MFLIITGGYIYPESYRSHHQLLFWLFSLVTYPSPCCVTMLLMNPFSFEVITHGLRLVRCFSVFKYRSTLLYTSSICHTTGIHRTTVHIHCNQLGSQFNVLVIHLSITIQMSETSFSKHDRIGCFVNNRSIQRFFLGVVSRASESAPIESSPNESTVNESFF